MKELQVRLIPMTTIGLLLLTFVAVASALPHALISNKIDKCPDFEPMSNFNLGRFLGGWYEIERYPMIYEVLTSCVWTNYTAVGSDQMGTYVDIGMTFVRFGHKGEGSLPAYKPNDNQGTFIMLPSSNYYILKTDYDTYSVNYNCGTTHEGTFEFAWIQSRTKFLPQETINELKTFLKNMGSDVSKFEHQDQTKCNN